MKARNSFAPASSAHWTSLGSFWLLEEIRPTAFSRPARARKDIDDADVGTKATWGFQPTSAMPLISCEVNLPTVTPNRTLAPDAFRVASWELIVGAVDS